MNKRKVAEPFCPQTRSRLVKTKDFLLPTSNILQHPAGTTSNSDFFVKKFPNGRLWENSFHCSLNNEFWLKYKKFSQPTIIKLFTIESELDSLPAEWVISGVYFYFQDKISKFISIIVNEWMFSGHFPLKYPPISALWKLLYCLNLICICSFISFLIPTHHLVKPVWSEKSDHELLNSD